MTCFCKSMKTKRFIIRHTQQCSTKENITVYLEKHFGLEHQKFIYSKTIYVWCNKDIYGANQYMYQQNKICLEQHKTLLDQRRIRLEEPSNNKYVRATIICLRRHEIWLPASALSASPSLYRVTHKFFFRSSVMVKK